MSEWFIVDENKTSKVEWHVVDPITLLAAVEADIVALPEDWKVIYGSVMEA